MQTRFKRHQKVKLLREPQDKDIEPYTDDNNITLKGMIGEVNVILPNGQYHVLVRDKKGEKIAYVVMDEESLEEAGPKPKSDHWDLDDVDEVLTDIHHKRAK